MQHTIKSRSVVVRSDRQGHWVEWINEGETGSLGPYQSAQMAEKVRSAKEEEFTVNQVRTIH